VLYGWFNILNSYLLHLNWGFSTAL